MGSAPMIALSPSGCPPPRLPPTPHRHSCESRNPSLGRGMRPRPRLPPLGTRVRGHDVVPPSFLRSLSSWKQGAGIHPRPASPPLGTRVRGDVVPPPFLRKQESIPGTGGSPAPPPPSGYPRPRARRRPTVFPAKAGIHPWANLPPSGYPRAAGTTWFHRLSCEACPRGNGEQESIAGTRERPRPISPLWVPACAGTTWFHRHSCESRNPRGKQESIPGPTFRGTPRARARRGGGSTVIPAKLVLVETGSRNPSPTIAQIPLASRPKSACKSLTRPRPLLYHSVQSFPEQGARPWKTLGAVVPARGCRTISERTYT